MTAAPADTPAPIKTGNHRVAVFAHLPDPHPLAVLLCRVLKVQPLDAVMIARHAPGVLPAPMSLEQSQQLVSLLGEMGIQAVAVAAADVPDLGKAKVVHHVRWTDEGLQVLDLSGNPDECIPWAQIGVIAVGRVPAEPLPHFVEQGRPSVLSAAPLPEVSRAIAGEHRVLELWLLERGRTGAFRLRHDRFNYETLGDAKSDSATVNFERFVRELIRRASDAHRTPGTSAFLTHNLSHCDFRSVADLQQQALLHWVLDRCARLANTDRSG